MHIVIKDFLILAVCLTWYHLWEETLQKFVILIIYSTLSTANLISFLGLGTKLFYSQINWQNCFGSVDGTILRIFRPKINQRIVYNGQKRAHGIKFQSLALPNELIGNLKWPLCG